MKILLISVGTRGDVEPFIAIAQLLKQHNHDIICCFPEQFRELTIAANQNLVVLNSKFLELLDSDDGKITMGGKASISKKIKLTISYARSHQ